MSFIFPSCRRAVLFFFVVFVPFVASCFRRPLAYNVHSHNETPIRAWLLPAFTGINSMTLAHFPNPTPKP